MVRASAIKWGWILLLGTAISASAQVTVGDNLEMNASGLLTAGYNGSYGDLIQSQHGLNFGLDGTITGSYYNPNFLNFNITPYYNQSHFNSNSQSLTSSSGVNATVNLFTGSHFPGSVSYRYDRNSTGNFGLAGVPNFTSVGTGQGFGISWSALFPDWPTLTVSYTQGSGSGNLYGTDQTTQSNNHNLNIRSSYQWAGFNLSAFYEYLTQHSNYPLFLGGDQALFNGQGNNEGLSASHQLPWNGQFYANYNRSSFSSDYQDGGQTQNTNSSYTTDNETAGVNFHPTLKLSLFGSESFVNNLSGYLLQGVVGSGVATPPINLGSSSYSYTVGGGAGYSFTQNLSSSAQATYYNQHYYGHTYTGSYISGTVNYNRRLWDTFTFSGSVVDSSNGLGHNSVGFVGNVNAFRHFGRWEVSGSFSYSQNVQSELITYTTSSYSYQANLHRSFSPSVQWTAAFTGSHSGLTNQPGTASHSEGYTTTLAYKWIAANAIYTSASGNSLLTNGGYIPLPPLPGEINPNLTYFTGHSYGGGVSVTALRRLVLSATYSRSFSDTLANSIASRNRTELIDAQVRYHIRRIGFLAGYTRFNQGFSAVGALPPAVNSYFAGISRWFDFF